MARQITSILSSKSIRAAKVAVAKPKTDAMVSSSTSVPLDHGFESLGTHCVRFISATAKEKIDSGLTTPVRVASFDLDDTLVKTKSGSKFARTFDDWKWFNESVVDVLHNYHRESTGFIVIFTNHGGVTNNSYPAPISKSMQKLLDRLHDVVTQLQRERPLPILVYASTKQSSADSKAGKGSTVALHKQFRKPGMGMWQQLQRDLGAEISLESSFFVGDAGGRKGDFSDSDKIFAQTVGVPFKYPEDYFK